MFDVNNIRKDFPILERTVNGQPLVYFDNAATSQTPNQVIDVIADYYRNYNSNIHRGVHTLSQEATDAYEGARKTVQNHFNAAHPHEIIMTSGTTHSINIIASGYTQILREGDELILSAMEHHSNIVPWQVLAEEKGAILKVVPMNKETGHLDMDVFESLLSDKTKIVTLQHVSNVAACINPIKDIVALTRSKAHPDAKIVLEESLMATPLVAREQFGIR